MCVALPKWPENYFKTVHQSRQKATRAYRPNIYAVRSGSKLSIPRPDFGLEIHNSPKPKPVTLVTAADVLEVELFLF